MAASTPYAPAAAPPAAIAHGPIAHQQHTVHRRSHQTAAATYRVPLDISSLDGAEAIFHPDISHRLHDAYRHSPDTFDRESIPSRLHHQSSSDNGRVPPLDRPSRRTVPSQTRPSPAALGQFGVLTPTSISQTPAASSAHQDDDSFVPNSIHEASEATKSLSQLNGKIVVDPPNLQEWREKLFNVDEMIVLSNEQYDLNQSIRGSVSLTMSYAS
jgi:glutathione S-transferase